MKMTGIELGEGVSLAPPGFANALVQVNYTVKTSFIQKSYLLSTQTLDQNQNSS